jgi:hypothetical protein
MGESIVASNNDLTPMLGKDELGWCLAVDPRDTAQIPTDSSASHSAETAQELEHIMEHSFQVVSDISVNRADTTLLVLGGESIDVTAESAELVEGRLVKFWSE